MKYYLITFKDDQGDEFKAIADETITVQGILELAEVILKEDGFEVVSFMAKEVK